MIQKHTVFCQYYVSALCCPTQSGFSSCNFCPQSSNITVKQRCNSLSVSNILIVLFCFWDLASVHQLCIYGSIAKNPASGLQSLVFIPLCSSYCICVYGVNTRFSLHTHLIVSRIICSPFKKYEVLLRIVLNKVICKTFTNYSWHLTYPKYKQKWTEFITFDFSIFCSKLSDNWRICRILVKITVNYRIKFHNCTNFKQY